MKNEYRISITNFDIRNNEFRSRMRYINKIIQYATLLFVFLIPYQARWIISIGQINGGDWEYGTQSLYATEIFLAGILVLVILSSLTASPQGRLWREAAGRPIGSSISRWILSAAKRAASRMTPPRGALLLFLIYAGLSVFWAIDKNTALIHWRFLIDAAVVFLVLSSGFIKRDKIYWAIIISAVIQAGWGIGQWLTQSIPASTILGMASQSADVLGASVVETLDGRWLRAYGSFSHPNILGAWLVLGLVSIISLNTQANSKQQTGDRKESFLSAVSYLLFPILLFGLLTTFSRSAWLAFGVVLVAVILSEVTRRTRRGTESKDLVGNPRDSSTPRVRSAQNDGFKLLALTILTVSIFIVLFPQPFLTRLNNANRLEYKSSSERTASLSEGWEIIKQHPLLGVGVGSYGLAVHRDIDSTKPAYYYQPTHNVFLLIWAELGAVGSFLILLIVFLSLRAKRSNPDNASNIVSSKGGIQCDGRIAAVASTLPRNDMIFVLPLIIISLFDHYLWSLYSGLMILAVFISLSSRTLDRQE